MTKRWLVTIAVLVVAVVLAIILDTMLSNHRPAIVGLRADPQKVIPSGTCQIACNASDGDGDQLSYNWSASGGDVNGDGATVAWTAPRSEGSYNITVTVADGRGGEVTDHVSIEVRTNEPPTIDSLVAGADWVLPSNSVQLTCMASDDDEDVLSYEWITDGGDISGTGAAVNWTAPQEVGTYNIAIIVDDGYGGTDMEGLRLSVNLGPPPVIEELCVAPEGHTYLRYSSTAGCDYDVWLSKEYDIECVATGMGDLIYVWSCDDGQIIGEGSKVTWIAPNHEYAETTVMVTVLGSDVNSITKSIVLYVPSCTCGHWGLESGCKY
jgi:hypothetical protein